MNLEAITQDLKSHLETIRAGLTRDYTVGMTEHQEAALAWMETFAAISLRVMQKTNPSKIRGAAIAEEIKARIHGRAVLED